MASLSGIQRPLVAAAVAAAASFSAEFPIKFTTSKSAETTHSTPEELSSKVSDSVQELDSSWVSCISSSKLLDSSFVRRIRVPVSNVTNYASNSFGPAVVQRGLSTSSMVSTSSLVNLYQSKQLDKVPRPTAYMADVKTSPPDVLYRWHLPDPKTLNVSGGSDCSSAKSRTVVVLLGWLGAKQKHLQRYADWYTLRGYHAITFTFPMSEIMSYQVGGKAEQHVDMLAQHLADWSEETGKNLVFHTFSNTGWLTYGVLLDKFQKLEPSVMGKIRGCVVDSAPVAAPDPEVWASGFSAALLKKQSVATKGSTYSEEASVELLADTKTLKEQKPAVTEAALLLVLKNVFKVVLNLPTVDRRLSDVLGLLSSEQPSCPQLYIYSSADRVIPADHVESFVEEQRKSGREVRACNFISTPHVDHFRNDPKLYSSQLTGFLEDCVLTCCKQSD